MTVDEQPRDVAWLAQMAYQLRLTMLQMVVDAGGGHLGGAFSVAEIMTALYLRVLRHDPANPEWEQRDRLLFSKGHGCLALYTALSAAGYFGAEELRSYCTDGGLLGGHPERGRIPGVEITTGSLGHGLSLGVGMALAAQLDGWTHRVFVVLSDGECNEGSVWEAAMSAAQFGLANLTAVIDSNKLESLGRVTDIMNIEPLADKLRAFGWAVREVDGHDMRAVVSALEAVPYAAGAPSAIIAHTVKGKGVSYMENVPMWHYRAPDAAEAAQAFEELERARAA